MSNFKQGWYVLYTRSRHERKVANQLSEDGINNYFPTIKTLRIWHDRKKFVDAALFPSYVFIYLQDIQNYYQGLEAAGCINYVKYGNEPAIVREDIINDIKLLVNNEIPLEVHSDHFKPGEQLIISNGPLTGLKCEVVHFKGNKTLLVRVNLLKRNILINIPEENVIMASDCQLNTVATSDCQ